MKDMKMVSERLKKHKFLKNVFIYTGLFAIIVGFIIYIFKKYDKSFVWQSDALKQHTMTLQYFRSLLVEFIRTGNLSTFTWNIGNGMNLFGNLSYYIFGDIFSYFSILVSTSKIELIYSILIFIRLYFIGISFLYFCKYKNMDTVSSIVGTLMYTFCTFAMYSLARHPYFLNVMILFPLIMVGIEKIIIEDKKIFYTIIIALLFIMNFYFAYMIAVIVALYSIILTVYTYKQEGFKKILKKLLQILIYSLIGVMISAIILLPTAMEFLNSERTGTEGIQPYSITYYRNLVNDLLDVDAGGYWAYWGVQSIILITLPIFVRRRKQNYPIFLLILLLLIPLLISNVGSVFCGFAYPNNRWIFIMSFLFSYITTIFINGGSKIEKKDFIMIGIFVVFYILMNCVFDVDISSTIKMQIVIAIVILLLIVSKNKVEEKCKRINLYNTLLIFFIVMGVMFSAYYLYDIGKDNVEYVSDFIDSETLTKRINTSNDAISDFKRAIEYIKEKDDGFYSISKYPYNYQNVSLARNFKSIGSYYSITPHYYKDLSMDLQNSEYFMSTGLAEFDYRTKISTLLGVKYYIKNGRNVVPYGYTKLEEYKGKSDIYVNNYSLPFGVLYDDYITEEEYENMTPLEKESSLLKTVVLQEKQQNTNSIKHNDILVQNIKNNLIEEVDYKIIDENKIFNNNTVTVTSTKKNTLEIQIDDVQNKELYLYVDNIKYTPYSKEERMNLNLGDKYTPIEHREVEEKYKWYSMSYGYVITTKFNNITIGKKDVRDYKTSPYYFRNEKMLFNLGYYDEISGTITLTFSKVGTYDFSSIQILAVSMDEYEEDINELRKSNFEVQEYKNGYLKGIANAEKDGILQLSTMYNKGWTVYVDGEKIDTFEANKYFLGIFITEGEHTIEMRYETPYLKIGEIISVIGVILLIGVIIKSKRKKQVES